MAETGRSVLVTGAADGIGFGIAARFAQAGDRVALLDFDAERLAGFKRPSRVEVVDELPLTVTGKVQKGRLRGRERRRALGILE